LRANGAGHTGFVMNPSTPSSPGAASPAGGSNAGRGCLRRKQAKPITAWFRRQRLLAERRPAELGLIANVKFRTAVRSLAGAVAHQKMEQDRITRSKAIRSERNWSQSGARVCFGSTTSAVRMTGGSPTEKIFAIRSTWRRCAFFSVIARLSASSATWKPG
jgi:hypothetical protein